MSPPHSHHPGPALRPPRHPAPTHPSCARYLPHALAFIAKGTLEGRRTLVHCAAGKSRSGAVAVEWLRRTEASLAGSLDAALALAQSKRSLISPNTSFMEQLRAQEAAERRAAGVGASQ